MKARSQFKQNKTTAQMENLTDEELIEAIRTNKDPLAFTCLYNRYKRSAFNIAYRITRNSVTAEEAVQEGFLRIWKAAETFRSDGVAKGWVLRIVLNKGLTIIRRNRNHRNRIQKKAKQSEETNTQTEPAGSLEKKELLKTLKAHLKDLTPLQKKLVSLSFGAGMSQNEIGRILSIPQSTVSYQLQETLTHLRKKLAEEGLTSKVGAALTIPAAVFCTGYDIPDGMDERILSLTAQNSGDSLDPTELPTREEAGGAVFLGPILAGTVAIALVAWNPFSNDPTIKPNSITEQSAGENLSVEGAEEKSQMPQKLQAAEWTFQNGPPEDLKVIYGEWDWFPPDQETPGLMGTADNVVIELPFTYSQPMKIRVHCPNYLMIAKASYGALLPVINNAILPLKKFPFKESNAVPPRNIVEDYYLVDNKLYYLINGSLFSLMELQEDPTKATWVLNYKNRAISKIETAPLSQTETADLIKRYKVPDHIKAKSILPVSLDSLPTLEPKPKVKHWDFSKNLSDDFQTAVGKTNWRPAQNNLPAALVNVSEQGSGIVLPLRTSARPFVVRIKAQHLKNTKPSSLLSALWVGIPNVTGEKKYNQQPIAPSKVPFDKVKSPTFSIPDKSINTFEAYFDRRYSIILHNGKIVSVYRYVHQYPSDTILISFRNFALLSVDYEELNADTIPEKIRNPDVVFNSLQKQ